MVLLGDAPRLCGKLLALAAADDAAFKAAADAAAGWFKEYER